MFTRIVLAALVLTGTRTAADPPKDGGYVAPLKTLIEMLQEDDRAEQYTAAKKIRDHYPGDKCLEALPHLVAAQGRDLARPPGTPGAGLGLPRMIAEAVQTVGPKRFKLLFEMTADKDPHVRAGAFRLLFAESDVYRKTYGDAKEKSELDLTDYLAACQKGCKDDSPLVRCQVYIGLSCFRDADSKYTESAVLLLAGGLEDRTVLKTSDHSPACQAANTLRGFGAQLKLVQRDILKAAQSQEEVQATATSCGLLGVLAKADKTLAPEIVTALKALATDTKRKWGFRTPAIWALADCGRAAEVVVPDLAALLDEPAITPAARTAVYRSFRQLGASAEKGVPALVKALQAAKESAECGEILDALKEIGPAAGEATKPLEAWMEKATDPRMKEKVKKTLDAIK